MDEIHEPDHAAFSVRAEEAFVPSPPEPLYIDDATAQPTPPAKASPRNPAPNPDAMGASLYRLTWFMLVIAMLLLSRFLGPWLVRNLSYAWHIGKQEAEHEMATQALGESPLGELSNASQLISRRVGPSVVHITVDGMVRGDEVDRGGYRLKMSPSRGQGSGVIVDQDGYILTNAHVVEGASDVKVSLSDGRVVPAVVKGTDARTDLAVLKITASDLIAAEWGDSDAVTEGGLVWALGSPFGLERSITFGILSAKHRVVGVNENPYQDFLQTDAAVNPGNSGGPLVDAQGRLIGINTAIVGESYQGISFALPSNIAHEVYDRLKSTGVVTRGWLGVEPEDLSPALARELGIEGRQGAYISRLAGHRNGQSSPAERAGIRRGDVIVQWNGRPVKSRIDLFSHVGMTPVGESVPVTIVREGTERIVSVLVEARRE